MPRQFNGERKNLSTNGTGIIHSHIEKKNCLSYIKIKWITDLNKFKAVKLLKQNTEENHSDLSFSKHYLHRTKSKNI